MSTTDNWKNLNKIGDTFSVTSKLADYVMNPDWYAGYEALINDKNTSNNTFLWQTISASCEDVGSEIYKKILNYINNISNIDTCEIHSLYSFAKMYGYNESVLFMDFTFPNEIMELVNIFSINKEYLLGANTILTRNSANTLRTLSGNDEAYVQYIHDVFYNTLNDFCNLKYRENELYDLSSNTSGIIWKNNILKYSVDLFNFNENSDTDILLKKIELNVSISFPEKRYADEIDNKTRKLSEFSIPEQTIINMEFSRREKARDNNQNISKYSYNRENKVSEYFRFITLMSNLEYNVEPYNIDISKDEILSNNIDSLLRYDTTSAEYYLYDPYIDNTASKLTDLCIRISYIRETIKNQAQKYYMSGSENLLLSLIKEILHSTLYNNVNETSGYWRYLLQNNNLFNGNIKSNENLKVDLIEYNDPTEYYNIAATVPEQEGIGYEVVGENVLFNDRYWENEELYVDDISKTDLLEFYNKIGMGDLFTTTYDQSSGGINASYMYGDPALYALQQFLGTIFNAGATSANSLFYNSTTIDHPGGFYPEGLLENWRDIIACPLGKTPGYLMANLLFGLYYSYNGAEWKKTDNIPGTSNKFSDVVYGSITNKYFALDYEKGIYESSDGVNWNGYNNTVNLSGFKKIVVGPLTLTRYDKNLSPISTSVQETFIALNDNGEIYLYPFGPDKGWASITRVCGRTQEGLLSDIYDIDYMPVKSEFRVISKTNGIFYTRTGTIWNGPMATSPEVKYRIKGKKSNQYTLCRAKRNDPTAWALTTKCPGWNSIAYGNNIFVAINTLSTEVPPPDVDAIEQTSFIPAGVYVCDMLTNSSKFIRTISMEEWVANTYFTEVFFANNTFYLKDVANKIYYTTADAIKNGIDPRPLQTKIFGVYSSDPLCANLSEDLTNIRYLNSKYFATTTSSGVLSSLSPTTNFSNVYPIYLDPDPFINNTFIDYSPVEDIPVEAINDVTINEVDVFKKFSGIPASGNTPYAYLKNKTHASYQLHPFVIGFKQYVVALQGIKNLFLHSLPVKEDIFNNINDRIDQYGNTINLWIDDNIDFSGYRSFYEQSDKNTSTLSNIVTYNKNINQDSPFNFDALNAYINNKDLFIEGLTNASGIYYDEYYAHLNLTASQRTKIVEQLQKFYPNIYALIEYKIYKYGKDIYDNVYMLYKKSYEDMDEKGQLWMRLKNHPIAFPAFIKDPSYTNISDIGQIVDTNITSLIEQVSYSNTYALSGISNSSTGPTSIPRVDCDLIFTNATIDVSGNITVLPSTVTVVAPIQIQYNTANTPAIRLTYDNVNDIFITSGITTTSPLSTYFKQELTLSANDIDKTISIVNCYPSTDSDTSLSAFYYNIRFTDGSKLLLSSDIANFDITFGDINTQKFLYKPQAPLTGIPTLDYMEFNEVTANVSGNEYTYGLPDYIFTQRQTFSTPQNITSAYYNAPIVKRISSDNVFAGGYNTPLYASDDSGSTWTSGIGSPITKWHDIFPAEINIGENTIYRIFAQGPQMYYSDNLGKNWNLYNIRSHSYEYFITKMLNRSDSSQTLYVAGSGIIYAWDIGSTSAMTFNTLSVSSAYYTNTFYGNMRWRSMDAYSDCMLIGGTYLDNTTKRYPLWIIKPLPFGYDITPITNSVLYGKELNIVKQDDDVFIVGGDNCGLYYKSALNIYNDYNTVPFIQTNAPSSNNSFRCIAYNDGVFVAAGYNTGIYYSLRSNYGNWIATNAPSATTWTSIIYDTYNDVFIGTSTSSGVYSSVLNNIQQWNKSIEAPSGVNWLGAANIYNSSFISTSGIYNASVSTPIKTTPILSSFIINDSTNRLDITINKATSSYQTVDIVNYPYINTYLRNELSGNIYGDIFTMSGMYNTGFVSDTITGVYNISFSDGSYIYLKDSATNGANRVRADFNANSTLTTGILTADSQIVYANDTSKYDTYALSAPYAYVQSIIDNKFYYDLNMFYNFGFNYDGDVLFLDYLPLTLSAGYINSNTIFGKIDASDTDVENNRIYKYLTDSNFDVDMLNPTIIEDYEHINTLNNEKDIYYVYRQKYINDKLIQTSYGYATKICILKYNKVEGLTYKKYYVPVKYDIDSVNATWKVALSNSMLTLAFTSKAIDDTDLIGNSAGNYYTYDQLKTNSYDNGITTIQFNIVNGLPSIYDNIKYFYDFTDVGYIALYPTTSANIYIDNKINTNSLYKFQSFTNTLSGTDTSSVVPVENVIIELDEGYPMNISINKNIGAGLGIYLKTLLDNVTYKVYSTTPSEIITYIINNIIKSYKFTMIDIQKGQFSLERI